MASDKNRQLQWIYFSISAGSTICIFNNFDVIQCSNMVGMMCLVDFYFVKKLDMIFHHVLVLMAIHYMNTHPEIETRKEIVKALLSVETSTVFLTLRNLVSTSNNRLLKNSIDYLFIYTFFYYRIYNYYCLITDNNTHLQFNTYSKNTLYLYQIYTGVYGLFILNLYWSGLILNALGKKLFIVVKRHRLTQ